MREWITPTPTTTPTPTPTPTATTTATPTPTTTDIAVSGHARYFTSPNASIDAFMT